MLPTERIYTAISNGIPDRVPSIPKIWVDLAANLTGIDLKEVIKDPLTALKVIVEAGLLIGTDGVRQFHFPERKIKTIDGKVFEIDDNGEIIGVIDMKGGLITQLEDTSNYHLEDPYTMAHHHFWSAKEPIVKNINDVKRIVTPNKSYYEEIGCGARQREVMKLAEDNLALIGDCSSATLAFYECLRGMETAMMDLIEKPKLVHAVIEKGVDIAIEKGKFNIDLGLKILRLNDSVANMSVISPSHFREFVFPYMKEVCDELHNYDPEVKIYCHICGNVLPVADLLVETGLDCIGPLDPLGGFTPAQMRQKVGDKVSLYGGVDTQSFVNSTSEEIIEEARNCISEAGKNGGYILGSGCVIPRTAKKENLVALQTAVNKYGNYSRGIS